MRRWTRFGRLYIADRSNDRVRRVDAVNQIITTVAGNGVGTYGGDGGPATAASLRNPDGVDVDLGGRIHIVDTNNVRIRTVDPVTQVIQTTAGNGTHSFYGDGGNATAATFSGAARVAVSASGDVFISHLSASRVRRVDAETGEISTIAGNGLFGFGGDGGVATSAALNFSGGTSGGVALDADGAVYIADTGNGRVRRVDPITGVITTTASNLGQPVDVAVGPDGSLYVADTQSHVVRKIAAQSLAATVVAGTGSAGYSGDNGPATAAALNLPINVAVDSAGNILIADAFNSRVRRVDAVTHEIPTVAGTGVWGYSGDGGLATNADMTPWSVTVTSTDDIIIGDRSANRVRRVDAVSQIVTTIAGTGTAGFSGDGGPATAANLNGGSFFIDVAASPTGEAFLVDSNARLRRIGPKGELQDATPPSVVAALSGTLGANGWYTSAVDIVWSATDAESPILSSSGCDPTSVTTDTTGNTFTCSASSVGGTSSESVTVKRDAIDPLATISVPVSGMSYARGTVVAADYTCSDATSGIASCIGDVPLGEPIDAATLGAKTFTVTATDAAGRTTTATRIYTVTDATPPAITANVAGTQGAAGWYDGNVSVTWNVIDGESTILSRSGCDASTVTSDTAGVTFTCSATSAGGSSSATVTVKRDATPPSLAPTVSPNPVVKNGLATAAANATDVLSGIASASCAALDVSTLGTRSIDCTASDVAGNTASASVSYTVINTGSGSDIVVEPVVSLPGGGSTTVDITFDSVQSGGNTSVTAASTPGGGAPQAPPEFKIGTPPVYYDVTTTATYAGTITLCFSWQQGQFHNENNIKLFHFESGAWTDVTSLLDTTANRVCGEVTSLSPFAAFETSFQFSGISRQSTICRRESRSRQAPLSP